MNAHEHRPGEICSEGHLHTDKCYCDIPRERLSYLVQQHFIQHVPTAEIMKRMRTDEEREEVAVVALLDVPREELIRILALENPKKLPHWLDCHNCIRQELAQEGLRLRGAA